MISEVTQSEHINPQDMSELIGLIYDAALDVNQWPLLTHALSSTIAGLSFNQKNTCPQHSHHFDVAIFLEHCYSYSNKQDVNRSTKFTSNHEVTIGETLLPHFERAAQLNQSIQHSDNINETLESVLDHVPIGIILVDIDGMIIGKNLQADIILLETNLLSISKNKIITHLSDTTKCLHDLISTICLNKKYKKKDSETLIINNNGNLPLSLLIAPTGSLKKEVSHAIIFIAAPEIYKNIPLDRLQDLYGLTLAESRLVKSLVNGKDLKKISHDTGVAISTIRSQLKSIFAKTDTSRQGDLIRLILVSPAIISTNRDTIETNPIDVKPKENRRSLLLDANDHRIMLSDGRELCFREYGIPDGVPVILMHTTPASRQQMHADTQLSTKLGIRLIVPDRPGFGLSTPKLNRTILDWCDDFKQLLNYTKINKFGVIGYGSGTPYALAVASKFPDAIQHISLLSAVAPNYSVRDLRSAGIIQRMIYISARNIPLVLVQMIKQSAKLINKDINKYMEVAIKAYSEPDQQLLSDPHVSQNLNTVLLDSADCEGRYFAQDIMLQVRDWEVDLSTISTPVRIWHGEKNHQNPIRFSILLEQQIPQCELIKIPDAGHFLIYTNYLKHALTHAAGIGTDDKNN